MFFKKNARPKIGLALGGGSAKGLAHIGVIKILEQNNIPIDFIAGTSVGSMIGGFYAFSKNISEIEDIALKNNFNEYFSMFFDPVLSQGIIKGGKVVKFIEKYIGQTDFESLKIPFACTTTNIMDGEAIIKNTGKVAPAIRASISIPVFFQPIEQDGKYLTDGGMSVPVPVQVVRDMGADIVIAVNIYKNYIKTNATKPGIFRVADNSTDILLHHLANENVKTADIVISPKVEDFSWENLFTTEKSQEVILAGEIATKEKINEIKRIMSSPKNPWWKETVKKFLKLN